MSEDENLIPGFVNPLAFHEVEEPWASLEHQEVTDEDLRRYLCQPGLDFALDAIVGRYKEISIEENDRIFVSPVGILQKLIWPLRYAKGSYALGNFLGTIALCGMVMEMTALLIFEAFDAYHGIRAGRKTLDAKFQGYFREDAFERLGQGERVRLLLRLGLIDKDVKQRFDTVRNVRNRHLHLMSHPLRRVEKDAVNVFIDTVRTVKYALGLDVKESRLALRPEILAWLKTNP
jgi:hypothetical protein